MGSVVEDVFASFVDDDGDNLEVEGAEGREDRDNEQQGKGNSSSSLPAQAPLALDINLAPSVTPILGMGAFAKAESREVAFNPRVDTLYAPVQGPATLPPGVRRDTVNNTPTGHVERTNMNDFLFDQQYHTFHSYGFAADPTINARRGTVVGNVERLQDKVASATVFDSTSSSRLRKKQAKEKRKKGGDPGSDEYLGPWAPPVDEAAPEQLTSSEVAAYEAWKPISKKKRKQMERQAMVAEEGEGEDEDNQEPAEKPKKEKKKKKKKNIETVFEDEDARPPAQVGPAKPQAVSATTDEGEGSGEGSD